MESYLERAVRCFLEERKIPYQRNYNIPQLPHRKYDFFFTYQKKQCLVECDGIHHFEMVPHFDTKGNSLAARQQADRLKTKVAIDYSYYLIRIDYTSESCINNHLSLALQRVKTKRYYFTNPHLYTYIDRPLDKSIIINECKDLARLLKFI